MNHEESITKQTNLQPGANWYVSEDIAPFYARHLTWCTEVGLVERSRAVTTALSKPHLLALEGVEAAVDSAMEWLADAEKYEAENGVWSRLNRDHPWVIEQMKKCLT